MAKWSQKFACFNFASIINDIKYRTSFAILFFHSPPLFPTCNPAKYPFSYASTGPKLYAIRRQIPGATVSFRTSRGLMEEKKKVCSRNELPSLFHIVFSAATAAASKVILSADPISNTPYLSSLTKNLLIH